MVLGFAFSVPITYQRRANIQSNINMMVCYLMKLTWMAAAATLGVVASVVVEQSTSSHNDVHNNNFNFQSSEINYELSTNVVPPEFCDPNSPLSISGYFGVTGSKYDGSNSKHYFYWFFERRTTSLTGGEHQQQQQQQQQHTNTTIPLLIWLNGGPGCSSLLGLLEENGPCLVNKDGHSTRINPYSWTEVAHVLYLDQPSLSGYSYSDSNDILEDDDNDDMIAEDAYFFLQSFFSSPEGSKYKDLPLYLTGEVSLTSISLLYMLVVMNDQSCPHMIYHTP